MLIRASLLTLLLTCPSAIALGQEPKPASPPTSKPAGTAVAEAIVKLRAAKLTSRLTAPRHFKMVHKSGVYRLRLAGTETKTGLVLTSWVSRSTRADHRIEYTYRVGQDGKLSGLEVTDVRTVPGGQVRRQGFAGVVKGPRLVVRGTENGKLHNASFEFPWSDRVLPISYAWFMVPVLFDQGLPQVLEPEVFTEQKVRPGYKPEAVQYTRTREAATSPTGPVHTLRMSGRRNRDATTITVAAASPRLGEVLRVRVDAGRVFTAISAKEYEALERASRRDGREQAVKTFLLGLHYTQKIHRQNKGVFASSFAQLKALDPRFPARLAPVEAISTITLRANKAGSKWMAVATPGKSSTNGERHLVITEDGKVHASVKPIALDDSCAIPPGATPFR